MCLCIVRFITQRRDSIFNICICTSYYLYPHIHVIHKTNSHTPYFLASPMLLQIYSYTTECRPLKDGWKICQFHIVISQIRCFSEIVTLWSFIHHHMHHTLIEQNHPLGKVHWQMTTGLYYVPSYHSSTYFLVTPLNSFR